MSARAQVRVLVVDDNPDIRDSLRLLLEGSGYDTEVARDGQQALEVHRTRPVDVLITDIYMPLSDGLETIQAFRRTAPGMKIIAMSGGGAFSRATHLEVASEIGADITLTKPFPFDELLAVFRRLQVLPGP